MKKATAIIVYISGFVLLPYFIFPKILWHWENYRLGQQVKKWHEKHMKFSAVIDGDSIFSCIDDTGVDTVRRYTYRPWENK
jgi:hypothetical protein